MKIKRADLKLHILHLSTDCSLDSGSHVGRTLHRRAIWFLKEARGLSPSFRIKFLISFFLFMNAIFLEACLNQGIGVLRFLA